ncbi:L-aspartate 1-decarboxylase [Desulfonauticus submarinus]|uniref:Aspartate 1-decarboxylase n=1 Tax=Desulfonauticus submarinus TaxID=206665 RepID=A0A1H0D888_9BACT|nr:aspartate 1-decarboxylase [Desulfonauticus submarinus]SDN66424.1 L-aspartate 1-decarboxylase [Desulfonauticus submarinus]
MLRQFLLAKIHRATITDANLNYEGSIAICPDLLKASGILPFEKVEVYNLTNGERFATYVIKGQKGEICLNGAAAHKGKPGDKVIIACYGYLCAEEIATLKPRIVLVNERNELKMS